MVAAAVDAGVSPETDVAVSGLAGLDDSVPEVPVGTALEPSVPGDDVAVDVAASEAPGTSDAFDTTSVDAVGSPDADVVAIDVGVSEAPETSDAFDAPSVEV